MSAGALSGIDVAILAGGLGTRLRPVLPDTPKVLAPVDGRPFLEILLAHLRRCGARRVILCVGHLAAQVEAWIAASPVEGFEIVVSREPAPLGTAGAVRLAWPLMTSNPVLVLNGDTFCDCDYAAMVQVHRRGGATLLCVHQPDASRYGAITVDDAGRVVSFEEKQQGPARPGLVSAGAYLFSMEILNRIAAGRGASLEHDVLPRLSFLRAVRHDGAFIDIGLPETLAQAASIARPAQGA